MKTLRGISYTTVLALSVIASGCTSNTSSEQTTTEKPTSQTSNEQLPKPDGYDVKKDLQSYKDVMKLTGYYNLTGGESDNFSRQWVKDNLKIDFNINYVKGEDFNTKVKAMEAAGQLPDIIMTLGNPSLLNELAVDGQLLPLDDLLKNYVPDAKAWFDPQIRDMFRSSDGKLYVITGLNLPIGDKALQDKYYTIASLQMYINQNMQKATNTGALKTPDDLYAYLKAAASVSHGIGLESGTFTTNAYTNTGYPSTPSVALVHLFGQFKDNMGNEPDDANGVMRFIYDNPAYVKFLKFFSKLYRENLMDKDVFTYNNETAMASKLNQGNVAWFITGNITLTEGANTALSKNIMSPYFPVDYPRDPSVSDTNIVAINPVGPWYYAVNKKVKDPARVAKFLEWHLTDEGEMFDNYGPPDDTKKQNTWYYDTSKAPTNGMNLPYQPVLDLDLQKNWDTTKPNWESKIGTWGYSSFGLRAQMNYNKPGEFGVNMADDMWKKNDEVYNNDSNVYRPSDLKMVKFANSPVGPIFKQKGSQLDDLLNKWEVKIITTAKSDEQVDSMFAQMMQEAKNAGYGEIAKEAYQIYKK